MKIIHIGLPKTATTTLQRYVFPELQRMGLISQFNPQQPLVRMKNMTRGYVPEEDLQALSGELDRSEKLLISLEGLVGADPASWHAKCKQNAEIFGQNSTILITIREPREYLRSLYQQAVHQGNVIEPEDFFLTDKEHQACQFLPRLGNFDAVCSDALNYRELVKLYSKNFDKVVVVALENLGEMEFTKSLFGASEEQRGRLSQNFADAPRRNVAYSDTAMRLTLGRERLLKKLGLKSRGSEDMRLQKYLEIARGNAQIANPGPLKRRFRNVLVWRKFMQKIIGKVFPYRKWELPDKVHLGRYFADNSEYHRDLINKGGFMMIEAGKTSTMADNG